MRKLIAAIATGLFLISGVVAANANLLTNGDFDLTDGSIGLSRLTEGQWGVYNSLPRGWAKGAGTAGIEVQFNTIVKAASGNYYVELDSNGGIDTNSSMFQSVTLNPGQYDLSFMYHARTNLVDDNGIKVLIGGTEIGSVSKTLAQMTPDVWEQIISTFTIQTAGTYQVGFAAFGADNSFGGFIDSVSLNAAAPVPEPATMLLFGAGLVGLAGVHLRRKKK